LSGITRDQWPPYIDEIFRICKPGNGWAQIIEAPAYLRCDDNTVPTNAAIHQYQKWLKQHYEDRKKLVYTTDHVELEMRGAGFIDIQVRHFKLHVGEWGNDEKERNMGRRGAAIRGGSVAPLMEGMDYFLPDDGERAAFVARVEQELWNPEYHLYTPMICVTGRKPAF